ncbi:MAG: Smr/MutS family protein [Rhodobacteraceae bacterium]|nr:Smr/MutS family protein [Paracoccaceae bacterium]
MTADRAHRALTRFILGAYSSGKRCVLVITGKGGRHRQQDEHHIRDFEEVGVLKSITPEWLAAPPIGNVVVGVYPAHVKHGGAGALYVYLRKNELLRGRGE